MIGVRIVHSLLHTSFFCLLTGVLCLLAHARLRRLRVREEIRVAHLQDVSSHASARLEALLCLLLLTSLPRLCAVFRPRSIKID